jgi:hypothetical protein
MMANGSPHAGGDREAAFIARGNAIKRFIQTVAMFLLAIVVTVVAALMDMAGLVAMMAGLSIIPGPLSFLWLVERRNLFSSPEKVPRMLRSVIVTGAFMMFAVAVAIASSLVYGAVAGLVACLLVYGSEFAVAVASRYRGLLKRSNG